MHDNPMTCVASRQLKLQFESPRSNTIDWFQPLARAALLRRRRWNTSLYRPTLLDIVICASTDISWRSGSVTTPFLLIRPPSYPATTLVAISGINSALLSARRPKLSTAKEMSSKLRSFARLGCRGSWAVNVGGTIPRMRRGLWVCDRPIYQNTFVSTPTQRTERSRTPPPA